MYSRIENVSSPGEAGKVAGKEAEKKKEKLRKWAIAVEGARRSGPTKKEFEKRGTGVGNSKLT